MDLSQMRLSSSWSSLESLTMVKHKVVLVKGERRAENILFQVEKSPDDVTFRERQIKRVYFLNVPAETILERLSYSMVDPVSGERYHTLYKPAITKEINDRLLINPKEMEETIRSKVDLYFRFSNSLEEYFEDAIFINGDQDPQTVFEYIESYMINPLPVKEIWDL